jgi:BirA family biotin operon repressor/biotin-[acetyl-CoA-carboxylase] ligase
MPTADEMLAEALRQRTRFGRLVHLPECASTQDVAAADRLADDAVFWADHQTRGRGRQARAWDDEAGRDLAVTLRVHARLQHALALPASVPVAVAEVLEPALGRPVQVKWPNDVFLDGRKLGGVLIDASGARPDVFLIGIGINVNRRRFPPPLDAIATSLALATGREFDRHDLLLAVASRLHAAVAALEHGEFDGLLAAFRNHLGLMGQEVIVLAGGETAGRLVHLDFERLELAGGRSFPLGLVQGIRRAGR